MTDQKPTPLPVPPPALTDPKSVEIARIWEAHEREHVSLNVGLWEDPAAWGVMLADFALQIAKAYHKQRGVPVERVLARIKQLFDAEWDAPTGDLSGKTLDNKPYE
jgi:hypothetical protein